MTGTEIAVVCAVGFGGALLGALVGGVTTALLELWKQVLAGQAAARVIWGEMLNNAAKVRLALDGWEGDMSLADDAWRQHALAVAPLLSQVEFSCLSREIGFLRQAEMWIGLLPRPDAEKQAREHLQIWKDDLSARMEELTQVESRSRVLLLVKLLFGPRTATQDELAEAFAPETGKVEHKM